MFFVIHCVCRSFIFTLACTKGMCLSYICVDIIIVIITISQSRLVEVVLGKIILAKLGFFNELEQVLVYFVLVSLPLQDAYLAM